tara:strand:- start:319 stop:807 length:489 start_codon:yes stop_codon:yes gene_type:complete
MKDIDIIFEGLHDDSMLPQYARPGDSGMDVHAHFDEKFFVKHEVVYNIRDRTFRLAPESRVLIPLGFKVQIPLGYEIQVRPRSGLALKHGITVLNTPGTIDSGYRGEMGVILFNTDTDHSLNIKHGDRVAQIVLSKVYKIQWHGGTVDESTRGTGGLGHTGV